MSKHIIDLQRAWSKPDMKQSQSIIKRTSCFMQAFFSVGFVVFVLGWAPKKPLCVCVCVSVKTHHRTSSRVWADSQFFLFMLSFHVGPLLRVGFQGASVWLYQHPLRNKCRRHNNNNNNNNIPHSSGASWGCACMKSFDLLLGYVRSYLSPWPSFPCFWWKPKKPSKEQGFLLSLPNPLKSLEKKGNRTKIK